MTCIVFCSIKGQTVVFGPADRGSNARDGGKIGLSCAVLPFNSLHVSAGINKLAAYTKTYQTRLYQVNISMYAGLSNCYLMKH